MNIYIYSGKVVLVFVLVAEVDEVVLVIGEGVVFRHALISIVSSLQVFLF